MGSVISFEMDGVPQNPLNRRQFWTARYKQAELWWNACSLLGRTFRTRAGWPIAEKGNGRVVTVTCYRVRLLDIDGLWASAKPCIDGLQKETKGGKVVKVGAGLIWRDDDPAVTVVVRQQHVEHYKDQRTVIRVERVMEEAA